MLLGGSRECNQGALQSPSWRPHTNASHHPSPRKKSAEKKLGSTESFLRACRHSPRQAPKRSSSSSFALDHRSVSHSSNAVVQRAGGKKSIPPPSLPGSAPARSRPLSPTLACTRRGGWKPKSIESEGLNSRKEVGLGERCPVPLPPHSRTLTAD